VTLSLGTRRYRKPEGLAFRDRERLKMYVPASFPFSKPSLFFAHQRFKGAPHVQWGSSICLYQASEVEWRPADGMFGFFERVEQWMTAAGAGQLNPDDAPLHPPVAYAKSLIDFVAKIDTPEHDGGGFWLGRADLVKVRPNRFDIAGWTALEDWGEAEIDPPPAAAAILFDRPLPMEYPNRVNDLIDVLTEAGLAFGTLYSLLKITALMAQEGEPAYILLGAPMRRKEAGAPLRQHLTAWEIGADALIALRDIVRSGGTDNEARGRLVKWMVETDVGWCTVLEDRPEIVHRRDKDSPAAWLAGKRILLLGCGALGSAIAEMMVRAGAAAIELVDRGQVKPGVLVRQRFSDADIGLNKAEALAGRLQSLGLATRLSFQHANLSAEVLPRFQLADWDLIIDATASPALSHRLEIELRTTVLPVPLIVVQVSASAHYGSVSVRMPQYSGGPQQIERQSKLEAFARHASNPIIDAFWPKPGSIPIFQPEPGCSEPTFTGSAADMDAHAGTLLNLALVRLQSLARDEASVDLVSASWLAISDRRAVPLSFRFRAALSLPERRHGYQVRESAEGRRGMLAEIRRIARTRSDTIETGGLMFGEIDDSHRCIWIDSVSGPPPDSIASSQKFLCGTAGTRDLSFFKAKVSGGSSRFVGIWHTHPVSRGRPSEDDLAAMVQLLLLEPFPPRQVVMLIIGYAASRPTFDYFLFRRDEFQLIKLDEVEGDAK
jgi:proteasome lid subunit RPN8/RPN11